MATRNTGGTQGSGSEGKGKSTRTAGTNKAGGTKAGDLRSPERAAAADKGLSAAAAKASTGNTAKAKGGSRAGSKTAAKGKSDGKGGTAAKKASGGTRAAGGQKKNLQKDLREFVQAHPGGWGHNEWIGLVNLLRDRGHDTSDTDAIGMALERERLILVLERVPGLGPQRVKNIADKFPRLWNLMQSNADEIATVASIPRATAEKVREVLH